MHFSLRFIAGIAILLAVFPAGSFAATKPSDAAQARRAIQAAYDRSCAASAKLDIDSMLADCAPDCSFVSVKGDKNDLSDIRDNITTVISILKPTSIEDTVKITSLTVRGSNAVVGVAEHQVVQFVDPIMGNSGTLTNDYICADTWSQGAGGWQLKITRVTSETSNYDGQPSTITYGMLHW
jgi:hypothetical protein